MAHKTGSVPGVVVDLGIVYLPERPFIVAAMINWLLDSDQAEQAISHLSLAAYRYFDRLANSNLYGHKKSKGDRTLFYILYNILSSP